MSSLLALLTAVTLTLHVRVAGHDGAVGLNTCTAVLVSPTTALTAAHCVAKQTDPFKAWVKDGNNKSFSVELVVVDAPNDLALLKLKTPHPKYAQLGQPVGRTDKVCTLNSGEDMIGTYSEGVVSNLILDDTSKAPQILHTAPILPGASGSGLFNKAGQLVGMNTMIERTFSFAVDIVPIRHLIEDQALKQQILSTQGG